MTDTSTRAAVNSLLRDDPDRYGPAFRAGQGVLDSIAPAATMAGVHPSIVGALLPIMVCGSILPEDQATIDMIEGEDGPGWEVYGYEDAADYAADQAISAQVVRTVVPDAVLDLIPAVAQAFVDLVRSVEPLPEDHEDVQVQPAVTMQDMLAEMFGGQAPEVIPVEESNPGTYL